MSYILNCIVASLATTVIDCYCYRDLCRFPRWNHYCLLIDDHQWLFGLSRPTVYCAAMLMDAPHMTIYCTEQLIYWLKRLFSILKDIHSKPLYALCYSLGFSSLLMYVCRCTGTRPELGAWVRLPFLSSQPLCLTARFRACQAMA